MGAREEADDSSACLVAGHDHHNHAEKHKKPLLIALVLTLVFSVAQIIAAYVANSLGLLADALHHLVDAAMVVVALIAVELSSHDTEVSRRIYIDKNGNRQSLPELIAAIGNSLALLGLSIGVIVEAAERINTKELEVDAKLMIIMAVLSIVVNIIKVYLLHSHMEASLNVRAIYIHTIADCAASIGILISGIVVICTGNVQWDSIMAICVAALCILNVGWVIYPAIQVLCQGPDSGTGAASGAPKDPEGAPKDPEGANNEVSDQGTHGGASNEHSNVGVQAEDETETEIEENTVANVDTVADTRVRTAVDTTEAEAMASSDAVLVGAEEVSDVAVGEVDHMEASVEQISENDGAQNTLQGM